MILVAHQPAEKPKVYTQADLEKVFEFSYRQTLTFENYRIEQQVKSTGQKALKEKKVSSFQKWLGQIHHHELSTAPNLPFLIRYMNPIKGYGLFATSELKAWTFIGEYTGVVKKRNLLFKNTNDYCFMYPKTRLLEKPLTIDGLHEGNYTRFINHHAQPNLEALSVFHDGLFKIIFRSIRAIPAYEELCYDYGTFFWRGKPAPI